MITIQEIRDLVKAKSHSIRYEEIRDEEGKMKAEVCFHRDRDMRLSVECSSCCRDVYLFLGKEEQVKLTCQLLGIEYKEEE